MNDLADVIIQAAGRVIQVKESEDGVVVTIDGAPLYNSAELKERCYNCDAPTSASDMACFACHHKAADDEEAYKKLMAARPSMEKRLENLESHVQLDELSGGIAHSVIFALEEVPDQDHPGDPDQNHFKEHVIIPGEQTHTVDDLIHRHRILSDAVSAIHAQMDETMERVSDSIFGDAIEDEETKPEDLN